MNEYKEIENIDDIRTLVDSFYAKVREDELLGPIFEERIHNSWPQHLKKMYAFWETLLLGRHSYSGSPFIKHADLPISESHFDRWLHLFYETVDEHFTGEKAGEAKKKAGNMALMFLSKLSYLKKTGAKPLK